MQWPKGVLLCNQVTTEGGFTVEAPNVVLATHMPIYRNFTVISRQNPYRFYALGFAIPKVPLLLTSTPEERQLQFPGLYLLAHPLP